MTITEALKSREWKTKNGRSNIIVISEDPLRYCIVNGPDADVIAKHIIDCAGPGTIREAERMEQTCAWTPDEENYDTTCGMYWSFPHGGPEENSANYCPKCGKKIVIVSPTDHYPDGYGEGGVND